MTQESTPQVSRLRRLASVVYDAHAGGRSPELDGPWWLGVAVLAAMVLATFDSPWKWLALPIGAALVWLPLSVRWIVALKRSVLAFRQELRS